MIKRTLKICSSILIFATVVFAQSADQSEVVKDITRQFEEITAGANSNERGIQIREELEKIRVKYSYEPFTAKVKSGAELKGWNIIAEIPSPNAKKTLMLGAHYDRVNVGIGAVDNASGSIAILELLKMFKKKPLENYNLKVAFWDLEEKGLLGSMEYVKAQSKNNLPDIYINFDVFGYGDTIFLWAENPKSKFSKKFTKTSNKAKVKSAVIETYPPSDHRSFWKLKTDSYSFSIMNEKEGKNLIKLIIDSKAKIDEFPKIARIIHTKNDKLEVIDVNAIVKSLTVIETAIRNIDK